MIVVQEGTLKNPSFKCVFIKDPHCNWRFANNIRHHHEEDLDLKWGFLQDYMETNKIDDLVITGHNIEKFDIDFLSKNSKLLGLNFSFNHKSL